MRKESIVILSLFLLVSSVAYVSFNTFKVNAPDGIDLAKIYGVRMLWNSSMAVLDVAVSRDGNYIAVVNGTGLYYFAYDDSTPKWWYISQNMLSVAISANGNHVIAGLNVGYVFYFANAGTMTGSQSGPTWSTNDLFGPIERGTVDISDDGECVVVGGTGTNLYYYANCSARSGSLQPTNWTDYISHDVLAVDISPDGRYVAVAGDRAPAGGFVALYKDANNESLRTQLWLARNLLDDPIADLALSDDGYAVAALDLGYNGLFCWTNATTLIDDPDATWTGAGYFASIDMSADGDTIVAGSYQVASLHFWGSARTREGVQAEDWMSLTNSDVHDVAVSDNGGIIAASAQTGPSNHTACFFKSDGSLIEQFDLLQYSPLVSMSGSGRITAIGGDMVDSLYVFEVLEDSTPPVIEDVDQNPASDSVTPDDSVAVYANVTDDLSGVKWVILNYTVDNETWFAVSMTNLAGDQYNGTIPQFPYCNTITYIIIAEDNLNNTITTEELGFDYMYHVVPEFPSQMILLLFFVGALMAVVFRRKLRGIAKI